MCEAALTGIPPGDHRRGSMSDSTTRTIRATAPALSARYAAVAHRWPYLATEHVVDVLDLAESKRTIDLIAESPFVGGYHRSDEDMAAMEQRVLGYVPREVLGGIAICDGGVGWAPSAGGLVTYSRDRPGLVGDAGLYARI